MSALETTMSRTKLAVFKAVATALALEISLLVFEQSAAAQAVAKAQKWEYGVVIWSYDYVSKSSQATWENPKGEAIVDTDFAGLHKKLGGTKDLGSGAKNTSNFLTFLGEQGWELVSHTRTKDSAFDVGNWTLKRPLHAKVQRWEYGVLIYDRKQKLANWENPQGGVLSDTDFVGLHKKMAGHKAAPPASGAGKASNILSFLGEEGWELVSHIHNKDANTDVKNWTLKRPRQ
jgi:hypothetical protein